MIRTAQMWNWIWIGVCGGLALIASMLVMVLHKDQVTTLAMASAATMFSFAVGLAYLGTKSKDQEVLACVATYNVALVMFVGTNP